LFGTITGGSFTISVESGDMENVYIIFVAKPDRKRPLERPRCKWWEKMEGNFEVM
jgi:hypothetical protein